MRLEDSKTTRVFTIFDAPRLDPVTVVLQDIGPGSGRLIVECWGDAWSAYWGGMGEATLAEFVRDCGPDYITTKMSRAKTTKREQIYLQRIIEAVQVALTEDTP